MVRKTPRPENILLPVWAWYKNYGLQQKPDRRRSMFRNYESYDAIMELEVPDELVILSDFDDWHCILNNFPIFTKEEESENYDWPNGYDEWGLPIYDDEFKLASWERVFRTDGDFVQACFWAIEPEYLVKIHKLRRTH